MKRINLNLFVYGTLRFGEHNFSRYFNDFWPDIISKNAYVDGYILINSSPTNDYGFEKKIYICESGVVPYAVKMEAANTRVKGDLIQFLDRDKKEMFEMLSRLDKLEGHPYFYKRKFENVHYESQNKNKKCKAFLYEYNSW